MPVIARKKMVDTRHGHVAVGAHAANTNPAIQALGLRFKAAAFAAAAKLQQFAAQCLELWKIGNRT